MIGPAVNLILAAMVGGLLYLALRPHQGWIWRLRQRGVDPDRVRVEDALKHLYTAAESGLFGSIDSLAGALEVSRNTSARLVDELERRSLIHREVTGLQLSGEGRRYALQVIRTHRLWEQYLAEETGIEELEWHGLADRVEHELTPSQVDALSARMGDPAFDPHGDPIPTAAGSVTPPAGQPLTMSVAEEVLRIVHIEDEPEAIYRALLAHQLQLGMTVRVLDSSLDGVLLDTGIAQCRLSPAMAANVSVQPVADQEDQTLEMRMSALAAGQQATVRGIAPGCRGVERRRLLDLGLVPGTVVAAEFSSPSGDPMAYRVRGALIALRNQQANQIYIEPVVTTREREGVADRLPAVS